MPAPEVHYLNDDNEKETGNCSPVLFDLLIIVVMKPDLGLTADTLLLGRVEVGVIHLMGVKVVEHESSDIVYTINQIKMIAWYPLY